MKLRLFRSIRIAGIALALSGGFSHHASAEILYGKYKDVLQKAAGNTLILNTLDMYISGLGEGIFWQHSQAAQLNGPQTFCPPPKMLFTLAIYKLMIEMGAKEIAPKPPEEVPIGLLLAVGLKSTYPCERK